MKRIITWIFAAILLVSAFALQAWATTVDLTVEDTYVYDFMRNEDGKFSWFEAKIITAFEDGMVEEETRSIYANTWTDTNYGIVKCADTQDTARWEVGNTYEVTYGEGKTFRVEVRPTPITAITVEDCRYCGYDSETGMWYYNPKFTVYYTDGSTQTGTGGFTIEYFGAFYSYTLDFMDTQKEEPWIPGNTYEVTATILGISDTFSVTVVGVQDIEVEDVVRIEGTGQMEGVWDEAGNYVPDVWMWYDSAPDSITVTFTDGSSVTGALYEFYDITGDYPWPYDGQSVENQWGLGNHSASIELLGFKKEYTVSVVENPVQSLEVEDVSVMQYTGGWYDGENYIYWPNLEATITLKDGTVINGSNMEWNGGWYGVNVDISGQYEEPWTAGNTYTVTATIMSVSTTFRVTIEESPVVSIEVEDFSIIEGTGGRYSGENYRYEMTNLTAKVTYRDGRVETATYSVQIGDQWCYFEDNAYELQKEQPWTVGNTYTVTATLLDVSTTFEVTITPSPVKSIVFEDIVLIQGIDSYYNGSMDHYAFSPVLREVLLKDGTYGEILGEATIKYEDRYYYVENNGGDLQDEQPWTPGNTYEVTGYLMGVSATFRVTVVENPIRELQLVKMPDKTEYLHNESFDAKGMVLRLVYQDGTHEDISIKNTFTGGHYRTWYSQKLDRRDAIDIYCEFEEEGQHTVKPSLFGKSCEIPVTVKQNRLENLSIRENADKTITITAYNSDNTSYEMKLLDLTNFWLRENDEYNAVIVTDKGSFPAAIYNKNGWFAIGIRDMEPNSDKIVISNYLPSSQWFEFMKYMMDHPLYCISTTQNHLPSYNGVITGNNIDRIIEIACFLYTWHNEGNVFMPGDDGGQMITGEMVRNAVTKYFAVDGVDLSLSRQYDPLTDMYTYYEPYDLGFGMVIKYSRDEIRYKDGVWSVTTAMAPSWDSHYEKVQITMDVDGEYRILCFEVNTVSSADTKGDMDGDDTVNDADAMYLLRHTLFPARYPLTQDGDVNGDGTVNDADAMYLLRYTLFPDRYPLYPKK